MAEQVSGALYRNSAAWQKSMKLTACIYAASSMFPQQEKFGLTNQIRRAAVSIPSNIAEGKGRLSTADMMRFLGIARGSVLEVQTQLDIAVMLGYGLEAELKQAHALAEEVLKMINASLQTMRAKTA